MSNELVESASDIIKSATEDPKEIINNLPDGKTALMYAGAFAAAALASAVAYKIVKSESVKIEAKVAEDGLRFDADLNSGRANAEVIQAVSDNALNEN